MRFTQPTMSTTYIVCLATRINSSEENISPTTFLHSSRCHLRSSRNSMQCISTMRTLRVTLIIPAVRLQTGAPQSSAFSPRPKMTPLHDLANGVADVVSPLHRAVHPSMPLPPSRPCNPPSALVRWFIKTAQFSISRKTRGRCQ